MRTASCTSARKPGATNQIQDFEFFYCLVTPYFRRARLWPAVQYLRLSLTFFVIIAFRANNSLYARSPDPSFLLIEGCGARD